MRSFLAARHRTTAIDHPRVTQFDGSLVVPGDFPPRRAPEGAWVVEGDLDVDGDVWLGDTDLLWVSGALRCRTIVLSEAQVFIGRGIRARSAAFLLALSTQELGAIESPLVVRDFADGVEGKLFVTNEDALVVGRPDVPGVTTSDLVRMLAERRDDLMQALRSGVGIDALFPRAPAPVSSRVAALIASLDECVAHEWTKVGERAALRVVRADGSKQVSVLSPDEATQVHEALARIEAARA